MKYVTALLALLAFATHAGADGLSTYSFGFNYLQTNSVQVHKDSLPLLKRLAADLRKSPGFQTLVIEGHTDNEGEPQYNLELSRKRAEAIRQVLIGMGVPAKKIRVIGRGASHPIASNAQDQGRALNRRIEMKVQFEGQKTAAAEMDFDP